MVLQHRQELCFAHLPIEGIGVLPGEPVTPVAEQAVAVAAVALHVPGRQEVVEPEQHGQVDVARRLLPGGQALVPGGQPGSPEGVHAGPLQPLQDRWQHRGGLLQEGNGLHVELQIPGAGGPHAEGVHRRVAEAEEIIHHDRMMRHAELDQPRRGGVEMAALVGGADQKHPHVMGAGGLQGRAVVLPDVIPVKIDVGKGVAGDRLQNHRQGGMGGTTHMADASLGLPVPQHLQRPPGPERDLKQLGRVDPMEGEQIHTLHRQPLEAQGQLGLESCRVGIGTHLGLKDPCPIGHPGQEGAELALGRAIPPGRFDVMEPCRHRSPQQLLQSGLAVVRDLPCGQITPALLEAHPPEGEHRHGQPRATEATGGQHQGAGG